MQLKATFPSCSMIIAPNILMILVATALRSAGSAGLWIYSTLMLQLQVPNQLLGRILALEMALSTVTAAKSLAAPAATSCLILSQLRLLRRILVMVTVTIAAFLFLFINGICWVQFKCHQGCCGKLQVHLHSSKLCEALAVDCGA